MATQFIWGPLKALIERFDEHGFGGEELQRLLENADVLIKIGKGEFTRPMLLKLVTTVNPFALEKVKVQTFYPKGWSPTTIFDQLKIMQNAYPDLDASHVVELAKGIDVPQAADGLFVVPKLSAVGKKLGINDPYGEGYDQLLESTVLAYLARQRKFYNHRAGKLTADRMRMRQSAVNALQKLEVETPGDFLVFPAQTGAKWAGHSPRNACWEMGQGIGNEFPLPAWCVGHILYTNPARLGTYEHLAIDCPGDEYSLEASGKFDVCLYFVFNVGELYVDYRWIARARDSFGSASGFLSR